MPRPTKLVVYWINLVRPSVCPSVCRHGFRSVTHIFCGNPISNFIWLLSVAMGKSLLIFSDVTFKMAAWQPYLIFRFPDSNFSLVLNIKSKLHWYITSVYEKKQLIFSYVPFKTDAWWPYWIVRYLHSAGCMVSHSVEYPSMVDPQLNIWYWGSKWNLHTVCWNAVGCEWGTTSVYFGITYVCFIPSRLPVFAVEPQYLLQYFFCQKYHLNYTYKKCHIGLKFEWGL